MYGVLSPFYKKIDFVKTYFIEYDENLDVDYKINDDVLKIRGVESMVPGVLQKSLDAFLIFEKLIGKCRWYVRSNISTVINFYALGDFLKKNSQVDYFGGRVLNLQWLDIPYGISDDRHFGTNYAQGTLIGFSNCALDTVLNKRHKLHYELIDDVSLGVFFNENIPKFSCNKVDNGQVVSENVILTPESIARFNNQYNPVSWRNKSLDRKIDISNMSIIADVLCKAYLHP